MPRRAGRPAAPADHGCIPPDSVDRLVADWRRVRPDLDVAPLGVITRLERVRSHLDVELERVFAAYGLSAPNFAVLVTLARLNEPGGVSQRRLMDELGLTSGTISVRMDRLVEQGLVERQADPDDKRNTRITLTPRGRALFERAVPVHLDNEARLLASLSEPERELLATLLRKLLVEFEGSAPASNVPARLGVILAPAHVTLALRDAVGLPRQVGLLVRGVAEGSPAAVAGIRQGDVLVRGGAHELRSVAALHAALEEVSTAGSLRLVVLRGAAEHTFDVVLPPEGQGGSGGATDPSHTAARAARDEHVV